MQYTTYTEHEHDHLHTCPQGGSVMKISRVGNFKMLTLCNASCVCLCIHSDPCN